jgi:hypothetical protein
MDLGEEGIEVDDLLDPRELDHFTYAESLEHLKLDEPNRIGYVRMAMRALARRDDPISAETLFEELIVNLIMEGRDADTNAAVAGAVLGAYLG